MGWQDDPIVGGGAAVAAPAARTWRDDPVVGPSDTASPAPEAPPIAAPATTGYAGVVSPASFASPSPYPTLPAVAVNAPQANLAPLSLHGPLSLREAQGAYPPADPSVAAAAAQRRTVGDWFSRNAVHADAMAAGENGAAYNYDQWQNSQNDRFPVESLSAFEPEKAKAIYQDYQTRFEGPRLAWAQQQQRDLGRNTTGDEAVGVLQGLRSGIQRGVGGTIAAAGAGIRNVADMVHFDKHSMLSNLPDAPIVREGVRNLGSDIEQTGQGAVAGARTIEQDNPVQRPLGRAAVTAGTLGTDIGIGMATGGAGFAVAFATRAAGNMYAQSMEQGESSDTAAQKAAVAGVTALLAPYIAHAMPPDVAQSASGAIARAYFGTGGMMAAQGIADEFTLKYGTGKPIDLSHALSEAAISGVLGPIMHARQAARKVANPAEVRTSEPTQPNQEAVGPGLPVANRYPDAPPGNTAEAQTRKPPEPSPVQPNTVDAAGLRQPEIGQQATSNKPPVPAGASPEASLRTPEGRGAVSGIPSPHPTTPPPESKLDRLSPEANFEGDYLSGEDARQAAATSTPKEWEEIHGKGTQASTVIAAAKSGESINAALWDQIISGTPSRYGKKYILDGEMYREADFTRPPNEMTDHEAVLFADHLHKQTLSRAPIGSNLRMAAAAIESHIGPRFDPAGRQLEEAFGNPAIAASARMSMQQSLNALREKYGGSVTLYRAEAEGNGNRNIFSYSFDRSIAERHTEGENRTVVARKVPLDSIVWIETRGNEQEVLVDHRRGKGAADANAQPPRVPAEAQPPSGPQAARVAGDHGGEVSKVKEPWEMTKDEFRRDRAMLPAIRFTDTGETVVGRPGDIHAMIYDRAVGDGEPRPMESGWFNDGKWVDYKDAASKQGTTDAARTWRKVDGEHAAAVTVAAATGKQVSSEVLKDYPDLQRDLAEQQPPKPSPQLPREQQHPEGQGEEGGGKKLVKKKTVTEQERAILNHYEEHHGEENARVQLDEEMSNASGDTTFKKGLTKSGFPRELEDRFTPDELAELKRRKIIRFSDPLKKMTGSDHAGSNDAISEAGMGIDKYEAMLRNRLESSKAKRLERAIEFAKTYEGTDPKIRLLADELSSRGDGKNPRKQQVSADGLKVGDRATINEHPVEVIEEDGRRVLRDGGEIGDVPLDALGDDAKIPLDSGSMNKAAPSPKKTEPLPKPKNAGEKRVEAARARRTARAAETELKVGKARSEGKRPGAAKGPLDPQDWLDIADIALGHIQSGVIKAAEFTKAMARDVPEWMGLTQKQRDAVEAKAHELARLPDEEIQSELRKGWGGPGEGVGEARPEGDAGLSTMKNKGAAEERKAAGIPERVRPGIRGHQQVIDEANARIKEEPHYTDTLVERFRKNNGVAFDAVEQAALHTRKMDAAKEVRALTAKANEAKAAGDAEKEAVYQNALAEANWQYKEMIQMGERIGTTWSEFGNARKMWRDELTYDLAHMEATKERDLGWQLNDIERLELKNLHDRLTTAEAALEAATNDNAKAMADFQLHHDEVVKELAAAKRKVEKWKKLNPAGQDKPKPTSVPNTSQKPTQKWGEKNKIVTRQSCSDALSELRNATFSIEKILPVAVKVATFHIEAGATRLADFTSKMIADIGEKIRPHIDRLYKEGMAALAGARRDKIVETLKDKVAEGEIGQVSRYARELHRGFVEEELVAKNESSRDTTLNSVHDVMKDIMGEGWTKDHTRDAISGRGEFTLPSQEQLAKEVRKQKGELLAEGHLAGLSKKPPEAPPKTGPQRDKPEAEKRSLDKKVRDERRKLERSGELETDPTKQLQGIRQSIRTRLQNEIDDIDLQLATGKRQDRDRTPIEYGAEENALKAERDAKKKQLDELFPEETSVREENQKIRALQETIKRNQKKIDDNNIPAIGKPRTADSAEMTRLKAENQKLNEEIARRRKELPKQEVPPEEILRRTLKAATAAEADAVKRLQDAKSGTFKPKAERPTSDEIDALKAKAEAARAETAYLKDFYEGTIEARKIRDLEKKIEQVQGGVKPEKKLTGRMDSPDVTALRKQLANLRESQKTRMTPEERAYNAQLAGKLRTYANLTERMMKGDYSPRTRTLKPVDSRLEGLTATVERIKKEFEFGRLKDRMDKRTKVETAADGVNRWIRFSVLSYPSTLFKLAGAAIGRGVSTPLDEGAGAAWSFGLKRLANAAPREGNFSPKALSRAYASAFTSGINDMMAHLNGKESNLEALHEEVKHLPPGWLEMAGEIHAAIKAPVMRAEYELSMAKRVEKNIRDGVDPSDPTVELVNMAAAYKDAKATIFMNDNPISNGVSSIARWFERPAKGEEHPTASMKLGAMLVRAAIPISKVPTNLVIEAARRTPAGLATGLVKAVNAYRKGVENLKLEEADAIMRMLKQGSTGSAFMLLGFLSPSNIGGYYQKGEKRDEQDVKAGDVKLWGHTIPSLLIHNPLLEVMQFGATMRRVMDSKKKKSDTETQGLSQGAIAATLGLMEEIPMLDYGMELEKFASNPMNELAAGVTSRLIPGIVQGPARTLDKKDSGHWYDPTDPAISRKPEGWKEQAEVRIPGLRQSVPPRPTTPALKDMHKTYEAQIKAGNKEGAAETVKRMNQAASK